MNMAPQKDVHAEMRCLHNQDTVTQHLTVTSA